MSNWINTQIKDINIDNNWNQFLDQQKQLDYYNKLNTFIEQEKEKFLEHFDIYPPPHLVFNCFNHLPVEQVKVVILGQDPYHQPNQAMGLSFSVPKNTPIPPSLRNIYQEIHDEFNISKPLHGDLTSWAQQGVLLLNTALTVRQNKPNSHAAYWKDFTDNVIRYLSDREKIIFILWGNNAKEKKKLIDLEKRNYILEATHPSPLSCNRGGFFGCQNFLKCNQILKQLDQEPINWNSVNQKIINDVV